CCSRSLLLCLIYVLLIRPLHLLFFVYIYGALRALHSFPTRRSSDLCTATRAPLRLIPSLASVSRVTIMQPRPVASRRPSDPPISTGLPVTTDVTVWR